MKIKSVIEYNPLFDSVRGVAILLVLFFHFTTPYASLFLTGSVFAKAWYHFANMGWIGVDIFFVLSGYLITSILLKTKNADNYYTAFYIRRTCRIFPLYYLALIIAFILIPIGATLAGYDVFKSTAYSHMFSNQFWAWAYLSNIPGGFYDISIMSGGFITLIHFWSLAIEEQFYLFWPLLVKKFNFSSMRTWCLGLIAFAFGLRLAFNLFDFHYNSSYSFTLCRIDCMCAGALVAINVIKGEHSSVKIFSSKIVKTIIVSAGVMTLFYLFLDGSWHKKSFSVQVFGYSILAFFFATILNMMVKIEIKKENLNMFSRCLIIVGKYSYGIYVWHLFVYPIFKNNLIPIRRFVSLGFTEAGAASAQIALLISFSLIAGYVSYHAFEKIFLKIKPKYRINQVEVTPRYDDKSLPSKIFESA